MALQSKYYDHSDPATALRLSQRAPSILSKSSLIPVALPWSIFGSAETPDEWAELEQTFYACLRAEDDESAHLCLERLSKRFGGGNQRVVALRGLYQEAIAKDESELLPILREYNQIIEANPMNVPVLKRRISLIRALGRIPEAITSLTQLLESFPTDTEAWCELSDLYQSQGLALQAIYCLEEALITVPNAWNLHARLGELNYMASQSQLDSPDTAYGHLAEAMHRFSRSIELCEDYLRGFYGLKITTDAALKTMASRKAESSVSPDVIRKLNELAKSKLDFIVQQWTKDRHSTSLEESEIIAVRALLDQK